MSAMVYTWYVSAMLTPQGRGALCTKLTLLGYNAQQGLSRSPLVLVDLLICRSADLH